MHAKTVCVHITCIDYVSTKLHTYTREEVLLF